MILLDANLLIYATNRDALNHKEARGWLQETFATGETVGFAWTVILAYLRLTTRPGLLARPISIDSSLAVIASWLAEPCATIVHPGPRHFEILQSLLRGAGTGGNLTSDAHLAAIALEYSAELCSLDRDFGRFPALRWRDPLSST